MVKIAVLIASVALGTTPTHCTSRVVHVTHRVVVHGRYGDTVHEYSTVRKVCYGREAIR